MGYINTGKGYTMLCKQGLVEAVLGFIGIQAVGIIVYEVLGVTYYAYPHD